MIPAKYQPNRPVVLEKKIFECFFSIYGHVGHLGSRIKTLFSYFSF